MDCLLSYISLITSTTSGPGSSVGIETEIGAGRSGDRRSMENI